MQNFWSDWDTDIVLDLPCTPADLARVIEEAAPDWAPMPDNSRNVWRWRIDDARETVWRAPGSGWLQALATAGGARLEVFLPNVLVYPYGATIARAAWQELRERLHDLGWLVEEVGDAEPARENPRAWGRTLEDKLGIWQGWLKARERGISQARYCANLPRPIDNSSLRRWARELKSAGLLDGDGPTE